MMTEMGYYFTQIESAVAFIKTVDASKLSFIDHEEFNKRLEEEVAKFEIKGHRFLAYNADDLTMRDIPVLLKDYKELVMENERLKKQMKQLKL